MMNRQQMLSILNTMSDDNLMQAMSAVGIECCDEGYELGEEEAEGLEGWNARDVSVPEVSKPPLFDKSKIIKPMEAQLASAPRQREYMPDGEDMGELSDFMMHQGNL